MHTITTSDRVNLRCTDEGTGREIVLLGGFAMGSSGWTLQRQALSVDHRVVAVDRRSHGESEHVTRGQRMARSALDVAEALDALALDDVVLMGSSMGSNVIWAYVELFGTSRLRGIINVDQTPRMVNDGEWKLGMYDLEPDGVETFVRDFPGDHNPFHKMPPPELLESLRDPSKEVPYGDLQPVLRDHVWADWREVLDLVDVPVLAIAGRHSPLWPCESSQYIADRVSDGRCVILEESGHVPFLEQPDEFTAAVREFVDELI